MISDALYNRFMAEHLKKRMKVSLLTVHVLEISADEDEDEIQDGIEVFLELLAGETRIGLNFDSLLIDSTFTDSYWDSIPHILELAEKSDYGIWQQMIWNVEGDFEVPNGVSAETAAQSIGWNLDFDHDFDENQLNVSVQFHHLLSAEYLSD